MSRCCSRLVVAFVLLFDVRSACAVIAVDGAVTIDPPPAQLLRGSNATITYTLTNTGDEPLDTGYIRLIYSVIWPVGYGPSSTLIPMATAATPPCGFVIDAFEPRPVGRVTLFNWVAFHPFPIPPGESRQCVTGLLVSPEAEAPFVQRFTFIARRGIESVHVSRDVRFQLGEQPVAIPGASPWSLALLAGVMALVGVRARAG